MGACTLLGLPARPLKKAARPNAPASLRAIKIPREGRRSAEKMCNAVAEYGVRKFGVPCQQRHTQTLLHSNQGPFTRPAHLPRKEVKMAAAAATVGENKPP